MRKLKLLTYNLLAVMLTIASVGAAHAGSIAPTLKGALRDLGPDDEVPVIIRLSDQADLKAINVNMKTVRRTQIITILKEKAATSQINVINYLKEKKARLKQPLWIINGIAATVPAKWMDALAGLPGVDRITLDRKIRLAAVPANCGVSPVEWNIAAVRAADLWNLGHDGAGVVVAIMDTGVDAGHPMIGPNFRGGENSWYDPNGEHATPYDGHGHGTSVAGLIVGGVVEDTAIGVAPGAAWIGVKIFNDAGFADLSGIHLGYQWLLDPNGDGDPEDAPDIVNNAWILEGDDICDPEFQVDIATLKAAEIAVIFAAGNTGPAPYTSVSPANDPNSLAVGSVVEFFGSYNVSGSSGRGPSACDGDIYPQVVAPGSGVVTTEPNDSYRCVSGTSFAAPHVSGSMALLLGAMESRGTPVMVSELEQAVKESAVDMGDPGPDDDSGYGLLDAAAAYDWLLANIPLPSADVEPDGDVDGIDLDAFIVAAPPGLDLNTFAESFGAIVYSNE